MSRALPVATPRPDWLAAVADRFAGELATAGRVPPAQDAGTRAAAVLVLLAATSVGPAARAGTGAGGAGVLLTLRSARLSSHAGQVSFPGGRAEPGDGDPAATALREAAEEVGLAAAGVDVVAHMPALHLVPSNHSVTPVLAWWREPGPVHADGDEVDDVALVPLAVLADPSNRWGMEHPSSRLVWPVFRVPDGFVVWGFTGWVVDRLVAAAGLERPWDTGRHMSRDEVMPGSAPA